MERCLPKSQRILRFVREVLRQFFDRIAQVLIGDISLTVQFGIVLTATLASIGAAGVPSAGIIILVVVLEGVLAGTGVEPAAGIALILGVDRILDMCRTAVNVTGDLTAAAVIERSEYEHALRGGAR